MGERNLLKLIYVCLVVCIHVTCGEAATYTWNGNGTDWLSPASWSGGTIGNLPGASDNVVITISGAVVNFSSAQTITIANLTLQNGAKIDFGTNNIALKIIGSLLISSADSAVITGNGELNVTGGATLVNALLKVPLSITSSSSTVSISGSRLMRNISVNCRFLNVYNSLFSENVSFKAIHVQDITGSTFGTDASHTASIADGGKTLVSGGNLFNGNVTFTHSISYGSTLYTSTVLPDTYKNNLTVNMNNYNGYHGGLVQIDKSGRSKYFGKIFLSNNSPNGELSIFELAPAPVEIFEDITISSVGSLGTMILKNIKTAASLKVGLFSNCFLTLKNFETTNPQLITLRFPNGSINMQQCKFPGGLNMTIPTIHEISACFFGSSAQSVTTISNSLKGSMSGGNTFYGNTIFNHSIAFGTNLITSITEPDTYTGDLSVNMINNGHYDGGLVQIDRSGRSTYLGNIFLTNSTPFGNLTVFEQSNNLVSLSGDISLSAYGSNGTITLSHAQNMGALIIGPLSNCTLTLSEYTSLSHNLTTWNVIGGKLKLLNCNFPGGINLSAPTISEISGNVFGLISNSTSISLTGNTNAIWSGNNTFNGNTAIENKSQSGSITLANVIGDIFKGDVTILNLKNTSSKIQLSFNGTSTFFGNLSLNGNVTLNQGSGISVFNSIGDQTMRLAPISGAMLISPITIKNSLTINKPSGNLILGIPLTVTGTLHLTKGNIISSNSSPLILSGTAIVNDAGPDSFISGPVRKTGTQAFTFPVGKGSVHAPLTITFPTAGATLTAEYFGTGQALNTTLTAPIKELSKTEYWTLQDDAGNAGAVSISFPWKKGMNTTDVFDVTSLILARSVASGAWNTIPATATGTTAAGMISTNSSLVLGAGVSAFAFGFSGLSPNVVVTNNLDDLNPGSLRYAISKANESPDVSIITFAIQSPFTKNIKLSAPLPVINSLVHIDATTQPLYDPANVLTHVEVSSDAANTAGKGFQIGTAGKGSSMKGLQVRGFSTYGVLIQAEQVLVNQTEIK